MKLFFGKSEKLGNPESIEGFGWKVLLNSKVVAILGVLSALSIAHTDPKLLLHLGTCVLAAFFFGARWGYWLCETDAPPETQNKHDEKPAESN